MTGIYRIQSCKYLSLSIFLFIFFFLFFSLYSVKLDAQDDFYGSVDPVKYVTGRFNPWENSAFVSLKEAGIPCDNKNHYLRKDAAMALKAMLDRFHGENPGIRIFVRSSTRTFSDQKTIWNDKWDGLVSVNGANLKKTIPDPAKRAREILRFSSMPGTSRHHWGTDVDLNSLVNSYFEKGEGKVMYVWLRANAGAYGFCQPYSAGRTCGYEEEKWHWSYVPAAKKCLQDWNSLVGSVSIGGTDFSFSGAGETWSMASLYVNCIDGGCR